MKIKETVDGAWRAVKLFGIRNADKIFMGLGIGCIIGGTIAACDAALKIPEIIDERDCLLEDAKANLADIEDKLDKEQKDIVDEKIVVEDEDVKVLTKETFVIHAKTAGLIALKFLPSVILEGVGIAFVLKSRGIVAKRYLAMSAAYTGLMTEFNLYRQGVIERYGEEVDNELIFGVKKKMIETKDEEGNTTEQECKVTDISKFSEVSANSTFAFDSSSAFWENNYDFNKRFVDLVFHNANEILNKRGEHSDRVDRIFFLNELLDMLGLPKTEAGQYLGWKYDENDKNKITYNLLRDHRINDTESVIYYGDDEDGNDPNFFIKVYTEGNVLFEN